MAAQQQVDHVTNLEDASFARLAAEKEQEWRHLQAMHAQSLEGRIREKDKLLKEQQDRFHTLKEDFKFNLKLLAERDQELDRLEVTQEQLRARLQSREAGVSELKIQIDELKTRRAQDERSMEDLQRHYQQRIREKQAEVEQYKISKDGELQAERDELEALRRDMKRRICEVEEELEIQRREMSAGFDDASRRREKEYRTKIDELSSTVLAHEMKAKLLSKELDLVRGASQQTSAELNNSDSKMEDMKKKLKHTEWELSDLRGMKDARIAELESQLLHEQHTVERTEEEFKRKHKELDRYAREKEAAVAGLKESQMETERKLQDEIRRLEGDLENKEVERRRETWEHQDALKDKEMRIEKYQQECNELRNQLDSRVSKVSKDLVSKDLVIESLRDRDSKLRAELECRKEDIQRYQKELALAAEKEQNMERTKAQLELDWHRRYEDAERNQYVKSEDLIARLTKSRDDAVALTKELEREMNQRDDLNRVLARDRDQAVATLRKHKLQIERDLIPSRDTGIEEAHLDSRQIDELQAQNESLIAVIKDMKNEMEEMERRIDRRTDDGVNTEKIREEVFISRGENDKDKQAPFTEEYVKALEKECRELKVEKRRLEERLSSLTNTIQERGVLSSGHHGGIQIDLRENDAIRSHVQSLNDTIGALRTDKVTTSAELRKCQARLSHLEVELNQKQYQPREKQAEVDQLRYELSSQARRHASESASHVQRIGQLELEVMEARREADEYYKGTLQTNLEATTLGQQVSELTMDLAGRGSTNRHGIQSGLVTQLQREVHNLRAQLARVRPHSGDDQITDVSEVQAKLKTAARHISRLAKEKQKLIEMGNRLRSELALYQPSPAPQPSRVQRSDVQTVTAGKLAEQVSSKLQNLEKLQYALTKQELQYARGQGHDRGVTDVIQVQLSTSSDSTPEITPRIDTQPPPSHQPHGNPPPHILQQSQSSEGEAPSSDSSTNQRHTPLMMSSLGEESMQDVWRLLDDGASPLFFRSPSPMRKPDYSPIPEEPQPSIPSSHHSHQQHPSGSLEVSGHRTHYQVRGSKPSNKSELSAMAAGRLQPRLQAPKRKVRNYAQRDSDDVR